MTELTTTTTPQTIHIVPPNAKGNRRSRLALFERWLTEAGRPWHDPDLAGYRDALLERSMQPQSAKVHLSTVRARYRQLTSSNQVRDVLYDLAATQSDDPLLRKAFVDETLIRLANGTDPKSSEVKIEHKQDRTDEEVGIRLTKSQASALLASPGLVPLDKLRDTAILATLLCTGIRESELVNLDVADLRQTANDELCLHVRQGKGKKSRVVFYGGNEWVLAIVDAWLARAVISEGAVFRGFYRGLRMRPGRLTTRAVQKIVARYPVMVSGTLTTLHPHDLRRTYARLWHDMGGDLVGLQQNLGHADLKTTIKYIGLLDASQRKPPSMYSFDLGALDRLDVQGTLAA